MQIELRAASTGHGALSDCKVPALQQQLARRMDDRRSPPLPAKGATNGNNMRSRANSPVSRIWVPRRMRHRPGAAEIGPAAIEVFTRIYASYAGPPQVPRAHDSDEKQSNAKQGKASQSQRTDQCAPTAQLSFSTNCWGASGLQPIDVPGPDVLSDSNWCRAFAGRARWRARRRFSRPERAPS